MDGMHSLKTAFYLSYFGKDARWNKNLEYIFKQRKCNKFRNGPKYKSYKTVEEVCSCLFLNNNIVMFAETRSPQAMFRGRQGLKYELASMGGQPIITLQDKISFFFKTRKSSALLYYNGKH